MHIHATASGEEMVYNTCGNSDNELNDVLKGVKMLAGNLSFSGFESIM